MYFLTSIKWSFHQLWQELYTLWCFLNPMWKSVVLWRRWSTCHWGCRLTKIQQWMFRRHYIWVWGMYLSCSLFSWHTTTGFLWAGWRWALQRRGGGPRLEGMGRQRRHSGSLRVRGRGQGSNSRLYFSQLYTTKHKIKAIAFSEIILLALQGALRLVRTVIQMCRQLHLKNRTNPSPAQELVILHNFSDPV